MPGRFRNNNVFFRKHLHGSRHGTVAEGPPVLQRDKVAPYRKAQSAERFRSARARGPLDRVLRWPGH
eukprot:15455067-Alexandrium_andersonii.AAC.1